MDLNSADKLDVDNIPSLGDALATIQPELVYGEAKRQYEALLHGDWDFAALPRRGRRLLTRQQPELSQHYRNLFMNATRELDKRNRFRLLQICFAYKTKALVLRFLDNLDENTYEWIRPFKDIVRDRAKDTMFENNSSQGVVDDPETQQRALMREDTSTGTYFIITTLPLAFPATFFTAFGASAPISHLNVSSMLSHPSISLLALSSSLKSLLRNNLLDFWKPSIPKISATESPFHAKEEVPWDVFFDYLFRNRGELEKVDGMQLPLEDGDGYCEIDLEMWLAGWRAHRQMVGNREKGEETRSKIQLRVSSGGSNQVSSPPSEARGVQTLAIDNTSKTLDKLRKSVGWNEELENVVEIPRGKKVKSNKRKKN